MKLTLDTLTDTKKLAKQIIKKVQPVKNQAAVLGLVGPLGAGKTTLVQYLAKELGVKQVVNSPTFVLLKEYSIKGQLASLTLPASPKREQGGRRSGWQKLVHIDAYRLESPQALIDIGLADYLAEPKNFIVIEWADKVKKILPKQTTWLRLFLDKQKRRVRLDG